MSGSTQFLKKISVPGSSFVKTIKVVLSRGDQYGSLYRFDRPAQGETLTDENLEKIDLDIGHAWGLCYAFDSLYVVVNDKKHEGRGLYRVEDTNKDDKFDKVTLLKNFRKWAENMAHTQLSYRLTESPFT